MFTNKETAAKIVQSICADDIIYIKPRSGELLKNELKASFEYNGGHGPASFFVTAVVSDTIRNSPELQVLNELNTIKFAQQADNQWQVIFSDNEMTSQISFSIEDNELNKVCQKNHIELVHV